MALPSPYIQLQIEAKREPLFMRHVEDRSGLALRTNVPHKTLFSKFLSLPFSISVQQRYKFRDNLPKKREQ